MKQSIRQWGRQQTKYVSSACAFTENRDVGWITTEPTDIFASTGAPQSCRGCQSWRLERIEIRTIQRRMHKPAEGSESIIDHYDDDSLTRCEARKVVGSLVPCQVTPPCIHSITGSGSDTSVGLGA